jgi:hypothetical protein
VVGKGEQVYQGRVVGMVTGLSCRGEKSTCKSKMIPFRRGLEVLVRPNNPGKPVESLRKLPYFLSSVHVIGQDYCCLQLPVITLQI